jgi:hypothetical protein
MISSFYIFKRERRSHSVKGVRNINKSKILIKRKEIIMSTTHLYKYVGTIRSSCYSKKDADALSHIELILHDNEHYYEKPPARIDAFGGLADYIHQLSSTDAEERYLTAEWYYDSNLYLYRIRIPSSNSTIAAKIITQADFLDPAAIIFGPCEYIQTDSPEPMDQEQRNAWAKFIFEHPTTGTV